jgi:hypothetical protein
VKGGWRKVYNAEFPNLYSSPSITSIIKSRRMIWTGHVARIRANMNAYRILVRKPEGKKSVGRPGGRMVLKWILEGY